MEYFETLRGRPIYNLQTFLRGLSKNDERIYPVVPDGIFGEDTKRSIESFQIAYNLDVTGEADSVTWEAIVREFEKYEALLAPVDGIKIIKNDEVIQKGEKHDGIYIIQAMIASLSDSFSNIGTLEINGIYDDATDKEVENLKIIFDISDADITKIFINSLVNLYEHAIVFKNEYYTLPDKQQTKIISEEKIKEDATNENNMRNEVSNDVIVWKFF